MIKILVYLFVPSLFNLYAW